MECAYCGHVHLTDEDEGVLFVLVCPECECEEGWN